MTSRGDRITLKGGKASFDYVLGPSPQVRVALRLALGSDRPWCAAAPARAGASSDTPERFVAQPKTAPPAVCPAVP